MIKDTIHKHILSKKSEVEEWFQKKGHGIFFPFYSSFDLRDSGEKIAPVDANLFPAGFNNVCEIDLQNASSLASKYLLEHYKQVKKIILLTEEHTKNTYYWDNISILKKILSKTADQILICVPGKKIHTPITVENSLEEKISVQILNRHLKDTDIIICNNDFSLDYDIPQDIPLNPSPLMGWKTRRKDQFFKEYNALAEEFSDLIGIHPWHLTIKTQVFEPFDPEDPAALKNLKKTLSGFLEDLHPYYKNTQPFAFLKNNSGTYGLGVTLVQSPEEVGKWDYKTRKKMKAAKGGRKVTQLILQEGISTALSHSKTKAAEPVIYMIGPQLAGGFLRTHREKGVKENLNSPGAVYQKLCMSDLMIQVEGNNEENVYGWITRLASLALGFEMKKYVRSKQQPVQ